MILLIVLEGQDCTGKTSLAPRIRDFLEGEGFIVKGKSFPEKTPRVLKYLELGQSSGISSRSFQSTCFLQKMDWQRTKESQNQWWVLDRWGPSGTVYGFLDDNEDVTFSEFLNYTDPNYRMLEKPAIGFILVCDPKESIKRLHQRGELPSVYETTLRQERLHTLFKTYAMMDSSYMLIDTTDLSLDEVYLNIESVLKKVFSL